ncbi:hypothetical protein CFC21_016045 [Triticum aestivum]|uniref:Uncharacterized protein n=3 Tax=Triticum TaxID=4564 RepID=A0A9R1NN76_TRITD|nr:uncharacterized protein LOC119357736 [Triticum dicoccoides]KAF7000095.1 hypothetical protein CFC21_016045 [Triticum aestivum]VAH28047.1 unnamed protein product [Triticum turgidum subsp. durum]
MGIINWVQNRLNTKQEKKRSAAAAAAGASSVRNAPVRENSCRGQADDELPGDWSMLSIGTIGTLGNEPTPAPAPDQAVPDFTIEEVKKLQDALNKLLRRAKSKSSSRGSTAGAGDEEQNLPLDRFLNCPSSLEVDRRLSLRLQGADGGQNGEFSPDTQIILSKARELLVSTNGNGGGVKQKSFKFLLKNMFACRGGFPPQPSLKDPVETKLEKLFKTMLQKKMSAPRQSNAASSSRKYYLEDKPMGRIQMDGHHDEEEDDYGEDVFKWDKTDSDFIVLEV